MGVPQQQQQQHHYHHHHHYHDVQGGHRFLDHPSRHPPVDAPSSPQLQPDALYSGDISSSPLLPRSWSSLHTYRRIYSAGLFRVSKQPLRINTSCHRGILIHDNQYRPHSCTRRRTSSASYNARHCSIDYAMPSGGSGSKKSSSSSAGSGSSSSTAAAEQERRQMAAQNERDLQAYRDWMRQSADRAYDQYQSAKGGSSSSSTKRR